MDCAEEVQVLRAELAPLPGVQDLSFDLLHAKLIIAYDPAQITPPALALAIARTGMHGELWRDEDAAPETRCNFWIVHGRTITTTSSGIFILLAFSFHWAHTSFVDALGLREPTQFPSLSLFFYLLAIFIGGWHIAPKAAISARHLRPDMNLLMSIAVIGAAFLDKWFEASSVTFLFALSLALEAWSVGRARHAISALMALVPQRARIVCPHENKEELVEISQVSVGTTVIVHPGEKIPLDGILIRGQTSVDESPITGESMPRPKEIGDELFAGTINGEGAIELRTTKPARDTTLANIIRLVGAAQSRRAPSEQFVEKFARIYTPAIMALAIIVAIVPPLVASASWQHYLYSALALLVIGCPCALVISTPVSIVAALASGARHGVLIKGGLYLEEPAKIKVLAFDKTGTLTEGHPAVVEVAPMNGHTASELIGIAASLEARSEHHLGKAIVRAAQAQSLSIQPATDYRAIAGKGATAVLNSTPYWIGSHRLALERNMDSPEVNSRLSALAKPGVSIVALGNEEHVCGLIAMADRIRPHAADAISAARSSGIRHIVMLTGDNRQTAEAVARELHIDEVHAELLPEDKVAVMEKLVREHKDVAMIGDGVNDAPAMALASVGVAMGAAGTDVALETADIALMTDDLTRLAWLISLSRRCLGIIRQNIALSLVIKAMFVVLALAGHPSLWAAIAADMGVSLLVVANALRLLKS